MEFWAQAARETVAREIVMVSMRECRELVGGMLRIGQEAGLVRRDLDLQAASTLLIGAFDGTAFQAAVDPEDVDLDALVQPMTELVERFIQSDGGPAGDITRLQAQTAAFLAKFTRSEQSEK